MDERREEWDHWCAPGAEEEVRHGLMSNSWELMECEADLGETAEVGTEVSSGAGEVALPGGLRAGDMVAWPTGGLSKEGVVATQEAATVADVEGDEDFDPSQFWLLLEQASYEIW